MSELGVLEFFNEWVIDCSMQPHNVEGVVCFVPYDQEDNLIYYGMNVIANKCPGRLIGVIHPDGQEFVDNWVKENPKWFELFKGEV